ncbi:hypothetical protein EHO61_10195 [Leptospira fluminis]|uniref:Lipoprotein n=1 Tax=Leptospira fluminis TaxID=2484979 RepID=A0A4R9GND8_9LEPT|nr:hypothetical protein [Leptospira fluminis]TGK17838.1 hypothetical protein EHO61_10195 [Leptospira fluminis]
MKYRSFILIFLFHFGISLLISCSTPDKPLPSTFDPKNLTTEILPLVKIPKTYIRSTFYPVIYNGNNAEKRNYWAQEMVVSSNRQEALEAELQQNLEAAGVRTKRRDASGPDTTTVELIPLGTWIIDGNSAAAEFLVRIILSGRTKICTERFAARTSGEYESYKLNDILWKAGAHKVPSVISSCLYQTYSHETSYEFIPEFRTETWDYLKNLLPGKPILYTGKYEPTITEALAGLPKTVKYTECAMFAGSTSGSIRCIAHKTIETPPIEWKIERIPTETILREFEK